MEALEFLKAAKRRCINDEKFLPDTIYLTGTDFESYVKEVEQWAKEHPVKTRQTEFLKMFPNVRMNDSCQPDIPPCTLDRNIYEECNKKMMDCRECYKEFWNKEVE